MRDTPDGNHFGSAGLSYMFRRAHISSLIALIAATLGFLGMIENSIAQILFYTFIAFATISMLLGMFEAESGGAIPRDTLLHRRRITEPRV